MRYQRTAVLSACGLVLVGLHIWSREARANKAVLGSLISARGQVQVDKVAGLPGTALMEGDVVATGSKSNAIIDLRSGIKITAAETTEVVLPYGTSPARLELRAGAVEVQTGPGQVSQINASFATSVILGSENGFPALCRISAVGSEVGVLNEKGRVEIHGAGAPFLLPPGKYVVMQAGKPQAGLQSAGKVIAAIPTDVVERQGAAAVPLNLNDPLYWQDLVRTEKNGRVRIELIGGTVLNIGARSQMRIVKHDAATEQTELELGVGKFRAQVVKLTKPDASFKIKTQTGVVGVVGTDIVVVSDANSSTVYCVDGKTKVCRSKAPASSSNCGGSQAGQPATPCSCCPGQSKKDHCPCCGASQGGQPATACSCCGAKDKDHCLCCVVLLPGQFTTVPANGMPSVPANFSLSSLQSVLNQTALQNLGTLQGTLGIVNATITATTVTATTVTITQLGNASSLASQAASSASGAANGLNGLGSGFPPVGCGVNGLSGSEGFQTSIYIPPSGTCP